MAQLWIALIGLAIVGVVVVARGESSTWVGRIRRTMRAELGLGLVAASLSCTTPDKAPAGVSSAAASSRIVLLPPIAVSARPPTAPRPPCTPDETPALTLGLPTGAGCARMLAVADGIYYMTAEGALGYAEMGLVSDAYHSAHEGTRFEARVELRPIEIPTGSLVVVRGDFVPATATDRPRLNRAIVSVITLEEAVLEVPALAARAGAVARAAEALPRGPDNEPEAFALGAFPDEPGLRELLSRFTYASGPGSTTEIPNWSSLRAIMLASARSPRLVHAHTGDVRSALDRFAAASGLTPAVDVARCVALDDCAAYARALDHRFARGGASSVEGDLNAEYSWSIARALAVDWLAARETWGSAEVAVLDAIVLPRPSPGAMYRAPSTPGTRPLCWPRVGEATAAPAVTVARASACGTGVTELGGLLVSAESVELGASAPPPGSARVGAPIEGWLRLKLANPTDVALPFEIGDATFTHAGAATPMTRGGDPSGVIPPRSVRSWGGPVSAPTTIPLDQSGDVALTVRSAGASAEVHARLFVTVAL